MRNERAAINKHLKASMFVAGKGWRLVTDREAKTTLYDENDGYYALALRDKLNPTNFYIGRDN